MMVFESVREGPAAPREKNSRPREQPLQSPRRGVCFLWVTARRLVWLEQSRVGEKIVLEDEVGCKVLTLCLADHCKHFAVYLE
jgi:hypothetical protein